MEPEKNPGGQKKIKSNSRKFMEPEKNCKKILKKILSPEKSKKNSKKNLERIPKRFWILKKKLGKNFLKSLELGKN